VVSRPQNVLFVVFLVYALILLSQNVLQKIHVGLYEQRYQICRVKVMVKFLCEVYIAPCFNSGNDEALLFRIVLIYQVCETAATNAFNL